jgi:hypothetical protein
MASKKLTDEELLAQLDDIKPSGNTARKPGPKSAAAAAAHDPLAELESLAKAPAPTRSSTSRDSRPNTPKLSSLPRTAAAGASARTSEDRTRSLVPPGRRSGDSAGEESTTVGGSVQPTPPSSEGDATQSPTAAAMAGGSGGWWGGIIAMGSAAVKQAGQAVKEIQQNEEALKWADQVRGNVGALRELGS